MKYVKERSRPIHVEEKEGLRVTTCKFAERTSDEEVSYRSYLAGRKAIAPELPLHACFPIFQSELIECSLRLACLLNVHTAYTAIGSGEYGAYALSNLGFALVDEVRHVHLLKMISIIWIKHYQQKLNKPEKVRR